MVFMERISVRLNDLESIEDLFLLTRSKMEKEGNDSWSHGYPVKEDFKEDILEGDSYF